ncbi:hypothetical protein AAX20_01005 [Oenococcus oeni]|nr:hypothetical protein AAX20_01005 [Oenococcus oeni]
MSASLPQNGDKIAPIKYGRDTHKLVAQLLKLLDACKVFFIKRGRKAPPATALTKIETIINRKKFVTFYFKFFL